MITNKHKTSLKVSLLFVFLIILSTRSWGQSGPSVPGHKTVQAASEQDITTIRRIYQEINSLKLTQQRFTYEAPGCVEEGVVNYFFRDKAIVKITESGSIGDGSWVHEYYYESGKAIFCYEAIVGGPAIGKVTKTEYRVYVKDNRPVRITANNKLIAVNDSKGTEAIQTAAKIYKAYAKKDFASALCD
ncbi:hypothetical protein KHS38_21795 [Mucilaginibacter sp. Bleaf8]|uniref:hypothetical protein n=1 Tax=Mucilaginibacter sp. Bleaf8 TaxID=2834430 RepID=UPI001BCC8098|nr:hypothetical protein [Mucilaginibacter sp. Bleaf8]MBS7567053.1 hypothetical protein [Mucilaginibacter sp. Bleaf8]